MIPDGPLPTGKTSIPVTVVVMVRAVAITTKVNTCSRTLIFLIVFLLLALPVVAFAFCINFVDHKNESVSR